MVLTVDVVHINLEDFLCNEIENFQVVGYKTNVGGAASFFNNFA